MPHFASPSSRYRLLLLDVDGTLVRHQDIPSPRTVAAIRAAQDRGCAVVICTGRHRYTVDPITAYWDHHGRSYGIYSNGAIIVDLAAERTLQKISLPPRAVRRATEIAHERRVSLLYWGLHAEEDGGRVVYTDRRFPVSSGYTVQNADRILYRETPPHEEMADLRATDVGVYGLDEADTHALAAAWDRELSPDARTYTSYDHKYGCWGAFVYPAGVDKAQGVQQVAELLGIPREETLAIGDHVNDLEMLRWAGLGVCIGDGHEDARACADHVTAPFAEDGAAQAIERFILGRETPR